MGKWVVEDVKVENVNRELIKNGYVRKVNVNLNNVR